MSLSYVSAHTLESLLNLIYLTGKEAENPTMVRQYMRVAQRHLEEVLEAEGLRARRDGTE
jgi:hypothetical protein